MMERCSVDNIRCILEKYYGDDVISKSIALHNLIAGEQKGKGNG
jgi:hypothetical protein